MYEPNVAEILALLSPTDRVVDIGGGACPFNRADYVIDAVPYEERGFYRDFGMPSSQGGGEERFTRESWIVRDLCDREPFPFADRELDFAICSQTLEDLRDPLWVCSEMVRVAKRGYLEVPSRAMESCRHWGPRGYVGLPHHRWLIDIAGDHVRFMMKYHTIHAHWRFSLPKRFLRRLPPERQNQWLFWDGSFTFEEVVIHGLEAIEQELERFVRATAPYPAWRLAADRGARRLAALAGRARGKLGRALGGR